MASKLSSILVKLGLIPIRKLDQAFQNQVIHGGTLDSALLELGLIREKDLIRVLVEASGLPSIQPSEIVPDNIRNLVSMFPQKLALRYQVIPVVHIGSRVGVLVNAEFDKNKIDEIGFMLGVGLIARVVPEPRLMHFASMVYGVPLDERHQRILDRIGFSVQYPEICVRSWSEEETVREEKAPTSQNASAPEIIANTERTPTPEFQYIERVVAPEVLVSTLTREHQTGELVKTQTENTPSQFSKELSEDEPDIHQITTRPGFTFPGQRRPRSPFSDSGPIGPLPEVMNSSLTQTFASETEVRQIPNASSESEPDTHLLGTVSDESAFDKNDDTIPMEKVDSEEVENARTSTSSISIEGTTLQHVPDQAPLSDVEQNTVSETPTSVTTVATSLEKSTQEHVVSFDGSPLSLNDFSALIATASHRDDMLVAFLRFCSNYAQYVFLFTVDHDAATGRFAIYRSQVDQHNVRQYCISLTFDSVLKTAAQNIPTFGVYTPSEGNQFLLDYLGLSVPMHFMAIPVSVGSRVVAIVLGTHSLAQSPASISEVIAACGLLRQALVRLIKQKKTQTHSRKTGFAVSTETSVPRIHSSSDSTEGVHTALTVPLPTGTVPNDGQTEEIIALLDRLEHLSLQQDKLDMTSASALMALGEHTLEVLRFYFPGILTYRDFQDPATAPPPHAHGPLLEFMVHWGLPVVPVLINLLDADNPQVRLYAVYLFQEIRFPDILFRIAEKLFDSDPRVREIASWVILSYEGHREYAEITSNLRGFLSHPDPAMQKNAIDALGRLRDRFAVEPILQLLPMAKAQISDSFVHALRQITLRDFGNQLDRWQAWWAINAQRHRVLWIIEGLRQVDEDLRRDAFGELKRIVGETFGYDLTASAEQRENAVRRAVAWWEQQGRHQWV